MKRFRFNFFIIAEDGIRYNCWGGEMARRRPTVARLGSLQGR